MIFDVLAVVCFLWLVVSIIKTSSIVYPRAWKKEKDKSTKGSFFFVALLDIKFMNYLFTAKDKEANYWGAQSLIALMLIALFILIGNL